MTAMEIDAPEQPRPKRHRKRALGRVLAVVAILLVLWIVAGALRAETAARDYFDASAPGDTHANITVQITPALPPFWTVTMSGDVFEPDQPSVPKYRSYMSFWIEPLSGWVISLGNG